MAHLTDKPQFKARPAVARDGKADGVGGAFPGQSGATGGVSQIAQLLQLAGARFARFVAGGAAETTPARAQRQPRGMWPASIVGPVRGHKKGTGQISKLLIPE